MPPYLRSNSAPLCCEDEDYSASLPPPHMISSPRLPARPSPVPPGFIYLGWADFHQRSQVLLQHRTTDTAEHLLVPRAALLTLQKLREAVKLQFGIASLSSPENVILNVAVAYDSCGAPILGQILRKEERWEECVRTGQFDAVYVELKSEGGAYDVRVSKGPWRVGLREREMVVRAPRLVKER